MECFRQIIRCIKSPFTPKPRVLEIGPPTNFRKEELPAFFSDADTLTSRVSREPTPEEPEKSGTVETVECPLSAKEKIQQHVRRMSIMLSPPASESA
ncbi:uncharacterized protein PFLUO_LOCUS7649 [Penicillium psychrofluorescens]|uniref:uncharacterized protein n=1 Tax=Penicillium psychrofluorescens TaxID=3158075 RepID=UPI003CCDE3A0